MTEHKRGLVEDGEKDDKGDSPLLLRGSIILIRFWGGERRNLVLTLGQRAPNLIPDRKHLRRNKSSTLQHTHNKSLIY